MWNSAGRRRILAEISADSRRLVSAYLRSKRNVLGRAQRNADSLCFFEFVARRQTGIAKDVRNDSTRPRTSDDGGLFLDF